MENKEKPVEDTSVKEAEDKLRDLIKEGQAAIEQMRTMHGNLRNTAEDLTNPKTVGINE